MSPAPYLRGTTRIQGAEDNMNPMAVAVAVVDEAGTLRCLQTEEDAALMRPDIAYGKAWGCIGLGFSTRALAGLSQGMPSSRNRSWAFQETASCPRRAAS